LGRSAGPRRKVGAITVVRVCHGYRYSLSYVTLRGSATARIVDQLSVSILRRVRRTSPTESALPDLLSAGALLGPRGTQVNCKLGAIQCDRAGQYGYQDERGLDGVIVVESMEPGVSEVADRL